MQESLKHIVCRRHSDMPGVLSSAVLKEFILPSLRLMDEDAGLKHKIMTLLLCPICHETVTDPCMLNCGHHYCRECLKLLSMEEDAVKCLCCSESTPLEEAGSRKHLMANQLISLVGKFQSPQVEVSSKDSESAGDESFCEGGDLQRVAEVIDMNEGTNSHDDIDGEDAFIQSSYFLKQKNGSLPLELTFSHPHNLPLQTPQNSNGKITETYLESLIEEEIEDEISITDPDTLGLPKMSPTENTWKGSGDGISSGILAKEIGDSSSSERAEEIGDSLSSERAEEIGDSLSSERSEVKGDSLSSERAEEIGDSLSSDRTEEIGDCLSSEREEGSIIEENNPTDITNEHYINEETSKYPNQQNNSDPATNNNKKPDKSQQLQQNDYTLSRSSMGGDCKRIDDVNKYDHYNEASSSSSSNSEDEKHDEGDVHGDVEYKTMQPLYGSAKENDITLCLPREIFVDEGATQRDSDKTGETLCNNYDVRSAEPTTDAPEIVAILEKADKTDDTSKLTDSSWSSDGVDDMSSAEEDSACGHLDDERIDQISREYPGTSSPLRITVAGVHPATNSNTSQSDITSERDNSELASLRTTPSDTFCKVDQPIQPNGNNHNHYIKKEVDDNEPSDDGPQSSRTEPPMILILSRRSSITSNETNNSTPLLETNMVLKEISRWKVDDSASCLAVAKRDKIHVTRWSYDNNGSIVTYNHHGNKRKHIHSKSNNFSGIAVSKLGYVIALNVHKNRIEEYNGVDGKKIKSVKLQRCKDPTAVDIMPTGQFVVVDQERNALLVYSTNNYGWVKVITHDLMKEPNDVACSNDGFYVTCGTTRCVIKFDLKGNLLWSYKGELKVPKGVCVDENGSVYVVDIAQQTIFVFGKDGLLKGRLRDYEKASILRPWFVSVRDGIMAVLHERNIIKIFEFV